MPIVNCSDVFERLTGYTRVEILGRNCRFLQSPDGQVQAGVKRKYVDDSSVLKIKNKLNRRAEVQLSIINYRKGGQPFMNLLTMIPVTWDTDEFKYYVGFQVDLVEQPSSVQAKNPGMYRPLDGSVSPDADVVRWFLCNQLPAGRAVSALCLADARHDLTD
jgi:PAS domain-containing protein